MKLSIANLKNSDRLWLLLPPLAVLLYFLVDLINGEFIVSRDTTNLVYVLRRWHVSELISHGVIPLWNDGIFSGIYHGANPQLGLYSPFIWLYFLFDGYLAHQIYIIILLMLGGLGMSLFLQDSTEQKPLSALLGICYVFSGVVLSYAHNVSFLAGICVFPWVLWRYQRFKVKPTFLNLVLMSLMLAWGIFEGDPLGCFFMSGYVFIDGLWTTIRKKSYLVIWVMLAAGLSFLLSAIVLIPPFEIIQETRRAAGISFEQASFFSMPGVQLFNFLVPSFWGRFYDGTFWGQGYVPKDHPFAARFWYDSIYISIPLLVMFFYGCYVSIKKRKNILFIGFVVVFTAIALGDNLFLHRLLHSLVPFYSKLRFPAKFFAYANLFVFALAAMGAGHFWRQVARETGSQVVIRALAVISGLFFLSAGLNLLLRPDLGEGPQLEMLSMNLTTSLGFGCCSLLLLVFVWIRSKNASLAIKPVMTALVVIGLLDILIWSPPVMTENHELLDRQTQIRDWLGSKARIKVLRDSNLQKYKGKTVSKVGRETVDMNWGMLENIQYVFGYEPTVPARMDALAGNSVFLQFEIWARILGTTHVLTMKKPVARRLRELASQGKLEVRQILDAENMIILKLKQPSEFLEMATTWEVVDSRAGGLERLRDLGEDRQAAIIERNEILFDGERVSAAGKYVLSQKLEIESGQYPKKLPGLTDKTTNKRKIRLSDLPDGLLIIKESFHPGWQALIDGQQVPIFRANYLNMAVRVKAGDQQLVMEFKPGGVSLGGTISLVTILLLVLILIGRASAPRVMRLLKPRATNRAD
jgi:hypothetical protein